MIMNGEAEYDFDEINRYVLLLRSKRDVEKRQEYLNKIVTANEDLRRLWGELEKTLLELKSRIKPA